MHLKFGSTLQKVAIEVKSDQKQLNKLQMLGQDKFARVIKKELHMSGIY